MNEPTFLAADAATMLFNLPDYRVISTTVGADGCRQVIVESEQLPGCPSCGVVATRRKERRFQRIRDIPVAGKIEVVWRKYRWYCQELQCHRLSFFESTTQVPARARSTGRLRDHLVDAVIRSGRAMSETATGFGVSWWMVRAAVNEACLLKLPDVDGSRQRYRWLPRTIFTFFLGGPHGQYCWPPSKQAFKVPPERRHDTHPGIQIPTNHQEPD